MSNPSPSRQEAAGQTRQVNIPNLANDDYLEAYRLMALSRLYDERCDAMCKAGQEVPHFHSGVGQEALMVASVLPLRPDDQMIYTHRGYGHLLAKGISVKEIALDTFMRVGGTNNGLGGCMHINNPELGIPGREGAFGTRFSIAIGLALAAQLDKTNSVTICFYGEAAGSRGPLYESLNMAVLWKLPVIFIAENNGWSYTTRTDVLYPEGRMSRVWRGYDIPVEEFDANDVEVTYETVSRAILRARSGEGPSVLEGLTYRIDPHIWFDKAEYQPEAEIARWRERDPIKQAQDRLLDRGIETEKLDKIWNECATTVDEAFAAVEETPLATWADSRELSATWSR